MRKWLRILALSSLLTPAFAQQTVFNVPSGDVLERGKMYGELDVTYQHQTNVAGFTPRIVAGIGHRIEIGVNFSGPTTSGDSQTVVAPAFKWKLYDGRSNGWAFLLGDVVSLPVQNRTYSAGNYSYAEFVKAFGTGTRLTAGGFHFSPDVVATRQRAGGQFAIEQTLGSRLTLAADWYTGQHDSGFFTPGLIVKLTPKLTWYGSYQIGNGSFSQANQRFLTELGWNLN